MANAQVVHLPSQSKFKFGDQIEWALQNFDDSNWQAVSIPAAWTNSVDPWITQSKGWYRVRISFSESELKSDNTSICCGVIGDAAEIYFNGQLIGSHGKLYPRFDGVAKDPIVVSVPRNLIRFDAPNILAIRVNRYISGGGILRGPLLQGDSYEVAETISMTIRRNWYFEGLLMTIIAIPPLFTISLILCGNRQAEIVTLTISSAVLFLNFSIESRLFLSTFGFHWMRLLVTNWCIIVLPFLAHLLVSQILYKQISGRVYYCLIGICTLLLIGIVNIDNLFVLGWIWLVIQWIFHLVWIGWSILAIKSKQDDSIPIAFGLSSIIFASNAEMFGAFGTETFAGQQLSYLGIGIFFGCGILVIARRFERNRKQIARATVALLTAHEEERKRIARDLHDGVCQTLAAVQLGLQMAESNLNEDSPELEKIIGQVKDCATDVRQLSHNLRPEFIGRTSLTEAMTTHCTQLPTPIDLEIHHQPSFTLNVDPTVKDALFRIFQEACSNAIKHGKARLITVDLENAANKLSLKITDDGIGINKSTNEQTHDGLGTVTIVERARLLGGAANIYQINASGGTCVSVSIPLKPA